MGTAGLSGYFRHPCMLSETLPSKRSPSPFRRAVLLSTSVDKVEAPTPGPVGGEIAIRPDSRSLAATG